MVNDASAAREHSRHILSRSPIISSSHYPIRCDAPLPFSHSRLPRAHQPLLCGLSLTQQKRYWLDCGNIRRLLFGWFLGLATIILHTIPQPRYSAGFRPCPCVTLLRRPSHSSIPNSCCGHRNIHEILNHTFACHCASAELSSPSH